MTEKEELKIVMDKLEEFTIKYNHKHVSACVIIDDDEVYQNCFESESFDYIKRRELEVFKPHLYSKWNSKKYGLVGDETKMKDIRGEKLYVGDVVTHISDSGRNYGKTFIAQKDKECFVMGIKNDCKEDGMIFNGWKIIKEKSFEEVMHNETHFNITAITNNDE